MINDVKYIKEKTDELESSINKLHTNTLKTYKTFKTINKPLLNYSIVNSTEIELYNVYVLNNTNMYFMCKIDFYLPSAQNVSFALLIDSICVVKSIKYFAYGKNEIFLSKDFSSITTSTCSIKLVVESIDKKQIELNNVSLTIYGLKENAENINYQSIEVGNDSILLSYLDNSELYYLLTKKSKNYYNFSDFIYYSSVKSYSFSYNTLNCKLLLFYIDENNILYLTDINSQQHELLDTDTTVVSSCYGNNMILVCYIQDFTCKYLFIESGTVSKVSKIDFFSNLINVKTSYNNCNGKFYLVLTDTNNQNYLVESINENLSLAEKLKASVGFTITINEVSNEV